ncbi:MAG: hypothetical protein QG584_2152 [Pseudomonadota bacterium]|nr:hypothetical protein [Pseudomonadota bacterium]MDQ5945607.1 hypothetical protein [Pseudomonadota bacterium]
MNSTDNVVQSIRREVVMSTYTVAMIAGVVLLLGNMGRNLHLGNPLSIPHIVLFFCFLAVYLARKRIGARWLAVIMYAALYLAATIGYLIYGFAGNSAPVYMALTFVAATFHGVRGGVMAAGASLGTMGIIAFLALSGHIEFNFYNVDFLKSPLSWVAAIMSFAAMAGLVLTQAGRQHQRLVALLSEQHQQMSNLAASNEQLEHEVVVRQDAEKQVHHLAHHDPLTGLANRLALEALLDHAIGDAFRNEQKVAVLFLDLDHFKRINDTLGHHTGDLLLIEAGRRLRAAVRASDTVARLGGDEFVVVLTNIESADIATTIAGNILQSLAKPYQIENQGLNTTASIGIAIFPQDGSDAASVMKNADTAMYSAKACDRNNFQFFSPSMNRAAMDRLDIEDGLREAFREDHLVLHYQPIFGMDGTIVSVEALVRWQRPGIGLQYPATFIPVAEGSDLINQIGDWVLLNACRHIRTRLDAGQTALPVAINLSARQLRQLSLPAQISRVLTDTNVPPALIRFELTESMAMDNPDRTIPLLFELKELGVGLALDNFGTGYSSLAYLKRMPLDSLKIDRSFVQDINDDPNGQAIIRGTAALAHSLGLQVVAEGVETAAQLAFLRDNSYDGVQGYFLARPFSDHEPQPVIDARKKFTAG